MAGKNGPETTQDGQADPAPAPASDEEEGHCQIDPTPQIPRPRVLMPGLAHAVLI